MTQWNVGGLGSILGLNYSSLKWIMEMNEVEDMLDCFTRIRVMELRALENIGGSRDRQEHKV